MSRTKKAKPDKCCWSEDEDGNWDTDCGEKHILIDGGPRENYMRFCCYCGSPLKQKSWDEAKS